MLLKKFPVRKPACVLLPFLGSLAAMLFCTISPPAKFGKTKRSVDE